MSNSNVLNRIIGSPRKLACYALVESGEFTQKEIRDIILPGRNPQQVGTYHKQIKERIAKFDDVSDPKEIWYAPFSVRLRKACIGLGIESKEAFINAYGGGELKKARNFGRKTWYEASEFMQSWGFQSTPWS